MTYLINLLIAVDQLANSILVGYPDETLSSRAHRMQVQGKWFGWTARAIDAMFHPGHCKEAYDAERARAEMPPLLRDPVPNSLPTNIENR